MWTWRVLAVPFPGLLFGNPQPEDIYSVQIFLPTCAFICIRSTNVGIQIQIQRAAQPAQSRAQRGSDRWSGAQRCPCRQGTLGTECLLFTRTPRAAQLAGSHVLDREEEDSRTWGQESEPPVPHRTTVEQGLCETTWGWRPWPGPQPTSLEKDQHTHLSRAPPLPGSGSSTLSTQCRFLEALRFW